MKCAGYVIAGAVLVPVAVGVIWCAGVLPAIAGRYFGFDPLWGFAFEVVVFGAAMGALVCKEHA